MKNLTNKENYFNGTRGLFIKAEEPKTEPDFVSWTGRKRFIYFDRLESFTDYIWFTNGDSCHSHEKFPEDLTVNDIEYVQLLNDKMDEWFFLEVIGEGILFRHREKISSEYWYTNEGVVRKSKHWGVVKNNFWYLEDAGNNVGFCEWDNFLKRGTKKENLEKAIAWLRAYEKI